nr:golgin subfamily A member 6-like protein 2 [Oryctolagus cuniculus]XP_008251185.1 golgin subfamily A member 6-like protein 2 [Oryctolagus cuniculus]XP_051683933.1 golgin subfamily A member 6-like protein 2 [Oryctolagus cuniculus]XP_051683934.1 golgin subfamily A member 6-like protein 2 [Oryctolagus cuniculus]
MDQRRSRGAMSVEKGLLLRYSRQSSKEPRGKQGSGTRPGDEARDPATVRGRSPRGLCWRRVQKQRPKDRVWVPWNGLIVIGKRLELLGRSTRKPRVWHPRLPDEDWRAEGGEKASRSPERMDARLTRPADVEKGSPRRLWGQQAGAPPTGAPSRGARATAGPRSGSGFEERVRPTADQVRTSGEDLRPGGYKLGQDATELRASGERLRASAGESRGSRGEKLRSRGESLVSIGEKRGSSGGRLVSRGEKRGSSGEKLRPSGERPRSSGEKLGISGEDLRATGDEKLGSNGKKLASREKLEGARAGGAQEEPGGRGPAVTEDQMETPFESAGHDEELEGPEGAAEVEEEVLGARGD